MSLRPVPLVRLVEAKPSIDNGWLRFECPFHGVHPDWGQCEIRIPLAPEPNGWSVTDRDDFERISVWPSIKVTNVASECFWHGYITNGAFVHCDDAR